MSSKEKEKRDFPRNIRQIGDPGKEKRIYLEDYAVAYLREVKGAVLFGELVRIKGARCYFISGAVEVPEGDFSEENWNYVTEEAGKSFEGLSVIGWFLRAEEIPEESYADQLKKTDGKPVSTYVPFRNGLFLSSAASIALSKDCSVIYYGAHSDDAAGNAYPDCSDAFNEAMKSAIELGSGNQLTIEAPFVNWTKKDVVREGLRLHVPYELTWSCYEGGDKPCGKCGTCLDRAAAFAANGVKDPALED